MKNKPEINIRTRALRYLSRREYSRAELRGKLLSCVQVDENSEPGVQQIPSARQILDTLLDDLTARGWLSDERATTQIVHAKRNRFGSQRIIRELRLKGIPEELLNEVLPQLQETELEAARGVWQKKFAFAAQDENKMAKQVRFLQSRGFALDLIFKMLNMAKQDD